MKDHTELNRSFVRRFFEPAMSMKAATVRAILWQVVIYSQWTVNALYIGILWSALESKNHDTIVRTIASYLAVLILIHIILELIKTRWRAETFYQQMRHIQDKYLRMYVQLDGNYLDMIGTGKLISIIITWFEKWTSLLNDWIGYGVWLIIAFISWIYFSFQIGWQFVIWYAVLFVCIITISLYLDRPSKIYRNKRLDALNDYSRAMVKFIMSRIDIIQNNKILSEVEKTGSHIDEAASRTLKQAIPLSRMFNVPRILVTIFRIWTCIGGSVLYLRGSLWIWAFWSMLWFMLIIDEVMSKFITAYKNISKDINAVEKLWDVFDNAPKNPWLTRWKTFSFKHWDFVIQNVSFSYGKTPVFKNLDLHIAWWSKTAFVGESWGWKTTLIKILAGYLRPSQWYIIIDGQKLSNIKLVDYYKHIGYLTQDPSVFDGTIYENLVYALDHDPEIDSLKTVISMAKCDFIREFEQWLSTEIGERWIRLSWWQKQRLAIAKIMLKNPNIILLDEPTSALDSFNEEQITMALNNLFVGKTVIVVAHRLQTVKTADRILLFEQGNIIEDGTHEQLVRKKGKYKKMLDLQSWF